MRSWSEPVVDGVSSALADLLTGTVGAPTRSLALAYYGG
jgi:hypothetical protein